MLRITKTLKGRIETIKADGRLMSGETEAFLRECAGHRGALVLDLSDLHFADEAGIRTLRRLKAQGARIVRARPYLSLRLAQQDGPIGTSP